jgi:hypothetical protein
MFGGHAPCPLRLGGGAPEETWTAQQQSRMAADVLAAYRTLPFARLTVTRASSGASPVLTKWSSKAPETTENEPTITGDHPNDIVIAFPRAPNDFKDDPRSLKITGLKVSRHNSDSPAQGSITAPHIVTIDPNDSSDLDFTVTIYATWNEPELEDYGGDLDKEDTTTERAPYSWIWYQELGAVLGSAYGQQSTGYVHSRKIAVSRALSAVSRRDEMARLSSTPGTAHPNVLDEWVKVLQVPSSDSDSIGATRRRAEAQFAARSGQDLLQFERTVEDLLGNRYVGLETFDATDPDGTWPSYYDLGSGVWASTRSKVLVDVARPTNSADQEFNTLMNVHFVRIADRVAPAWVWFDWTSTEEGGFFLDESELDYTGL